MGKVWRIGVEELLHCGVAVKQTSVGEGSGVTATGCGIWGIRSATRMVQWQSE